MRRVRPDAVACRYGGDEFAVAVPACTASRANDIADDIRRAVHDTAPVLAGVRFPAGSLSISVGVALRSGGRIDGAPSEDETAETLFRAADAALYRAKAQGRNHVSVA